MLGFVYMDIVFVPFGNCCISCVCQLQQVEPLLIFLQLLLELTLFLDE